MVSTIIRPSSLPILETDTDPILSWRGFFHFGSRLSRKRCVKELAILYKESAHSLLCSAYADGQFVVMLPHEIPIALAFLVYRNSKIHSGGGYNFSIQILKVGT